MEELCQWEAGKRQGGREAHTSFLTLTPVECNMKERGRLFNFNHGQGGKRKKAVN